jgi:hypothetical protein
VGASSPRTIAVTSAGVVPTVQRCAGAHRALSFYRRGFTWWRERALLPGAPARAWYDCKTTVRRVVEWRDRFWAARRHAKQWLYDWPSWLPRNWYTVGRCETGYGGDPNFEHQNSRFVSAFGISRSIYARDASVHGVRRWPTDAEQARGVPLPPPRHQYLAALGHYALFGDGWTCPGP